MSSEKNEDKYRLKEVQLRLKEGQGLYSNTVIKTAQDAVDLIRREISSYDREVVCVLNLSVKGNPITFSRLDPRYHPTNFNIAAIGTTSSAVTSAANILKSGILSNASCFILLHNHPTGDVTPSSPDFEMTRTAIFAGKLMGIPCMDHIIVGEEGYFSFQEKSLTFFCCSSPAAQNGRVCTSSKACRASSAFKASTTCKIHKNPPKNFYNPERIIISPTQENKNNSCHFIRCFSLQIGPKTLISCTSKGILCLRTPVSEGLLPARL